MLQDYDTPGILPPSARIDHTLISDSQYPWKLWDAWKYPAFAVRKGPLVIGVDFSKDSLLPCNSFLQLRL